MKKLLILALTLALLTTTCTTAKTVAKPKLALASNYLTKDNSTRKIKVTWTKVNTAKSYQIQRSRYKDFKTIASAVNTSTTSRTYSLSNSNNFSKDYYVRVRTKQNNGKFGAWSNVVKAKGIDVKEESTTKVLGIQGNVVHECVYCGESEFINELFNYCPWCGQKLDWSEKNDD